MADDIFLLCAPADAELACKGSIFDRFCSQCSARVMIAPSGQRILKQMPHAKIICGRCVVHSLPAGPPVDLEDPIGLADSAEIPSIDLAGSADEILHEVTNAKPNMWRKRN